MRAIRVAVAGLGTVGRETVRLLRQNQKRFNLALVAVADRDVSREAKTLGLSREVVRFTNPLKLATLPSVDIVVELLGGLDIPKRLVLQSLASGKSVVTANKRLLAYEWDRLQSAAEKGGGRLGIEASVAGGIPLLRALETGLAAGRVEAVRGILNGTTNFILTRMEEGACASEALAEAQRLGFAEKDPSFDLSGKDTAQKISVLAALLTGSGVKPERIARQGIEGVTAEDVAFARSELTCAPRLLGTVRLSWGPVTKIEAHVAPTLVPLSHPLAAVRREYNAVLVQAAPTGDLLFYGKGAGPGPTASAVVGDVLELSRELQGGLAARRSPGGKAVLAPAGDSVSGFYLRLSAQDRPGVLARVTAALARRGISISTIHQPPRAGGGAVPVILTTHPAPSGRFEQARRDILSLPGVSRRHAVMRLFS